MSGKKEEFSQSLQKLFEERAKFLFRDRSVLVEEVDGFQIRRIVDINPFEEDVEYHVSYFSKDDQPTDSSPTGKKLEMSFFYSPSSRESPLIHMRWHTDVSIEDYLRAMSTFLEPGEAVKIYASLDYKSEPRVLSAPIVLQAVEPELSRSQEMGVYGIRMYSSMGLFSIRKMGVDTHVETMMNLEQMKVGGMQEALGVFYETTTDCAMPRSVFDRQLFYVLSDNLFKNT